MRVSTLATFIVLALLLTGCQLPYLVSGAVEQVRILKSRTPLKKAISSGTLEESEVSKLKYAQKASQYANNLGLECKNNFKTYVKLKRPYVSYLVIASKKNELKLKKWRFPLVGSFPYLGFFSEKKAKKYQKKLIKKNYDTYLRGASAYSSLGWFNDPILSSMVRGPKEGLAETIFHECFHGTFFMKNKVELNERLAVFIAHKSLLSFLNTENKMIEQEKKAWHDQQLFAAFLQETLVKAEKFYKTDFSNRDQIFENIRIKYQTELVPKLKVLSYKSVFDNNLNNAKLLAFKTYFHDFKNLNHLFENKFNHDIKAMIKYFKDLETKSFKKKKNALHKDSLL